MNVIHIPPRPLSKHVVLLCSPYLCYCCEEEMVGSEVELSVGRLEWVALCEVIDSWLMHSGYRLHFCTHNSPSGFCSFIRMDEYLKTQWLCWILHHLSKVCCEYVSLQWKEALWMCQHGCPTVCISHWHSDHISLSVSLIGETHLMCILNCVLSLWTDEDDIRGMFIILIWF